MKINKRVKYKSKLIKLKLINNRIYKKNDRNDFIKIEDIISRLKKALHIVYKYKSHDKRILFTGASFHHDKKLKNLTNNSKHMYIPESIWMSGILTNQQSCFRYLRKNQQSINPKISAILFETEKKNDLIMMLDSFNNSSALNEGYLTRTPVISLGLNLDNSDVKSSYKIPGDFEFTNKKMRNNFFYSILNATFKKARTVFESQRRNKKPMPIKKLAGKFKKIF